MSQFKRKFYTRDERQQILDYIIKNSYYFQLRGRLIWQDMERHQVCPGRTWQSMKEHFQKNIIYNLDSLNISTKEKQNLTTGYHGTFKDRPVKRNRWFKSSLGDENDNISKKSKFSSCNTPSTSSQPTQSLDGGNSSKTPDVSTTKTVEDTRTESETDSDSSVEPEPFSKEEDEKIIHFMKSNVSWRVPKRFDLLYEMCHQEVLLKRDAASIKQRFLDVILPNLHTSEIVTMDEVYFFYDRVKWDIPQEFHGLKSTDKTETHNTSINSENSKNTTELSQNSTQNTTDLNLTDLPNKSSDTSSETNLICAESTSNNTIIPTTKLSQNSTQNTTDLNLTDLPNKSSDTSSETNLIIAESTSNNTINPTTKLSQNSTQNTTDLNLITALPNKSSDTSSETNLIIAESTSNNTINPTTKLSQNSTQNTTDLNLITALPNKSSDTSSETNLIIAESTSNNTIIPTTKLSQNSTQNTTDLNLITALPNKSSDTSSETNLIIAESTSNNTIIPTTKDVAVQTDNDDFYFYAHTVAGQLCLTVENIDHIFISEIDINKNDIINDLTKRNIPKENIHIVSDKYYNQLQRLKKVSNLLEKKILQFLQGKVSLNKEKVEELNMKCSCFEELIKEQEVHVISSDDEDESLNIPKKCCAINLESSTSIIDLSSSSDKKTDDNNEEDINLSYEPSPIISLAKRCKNTYFNKHKLQLLKSSQENAQDTQQNTLPPVIYDRRNVSFSSIATQTDDNFVSCGETLPRQKVVSKEEEEETQFEFLSSHFFVDNEIDDEVIVIDDKEDPCAL